MEDIILQQPAKAEDVAGKSGQFVQICSATENNLSTINIHILMLKQISNTHTMELLNNIV